MPFKFSLLRVGICSTHGYERLHDVQVIGDIEHITEIEAEHNETNLNLMLAGVMPSA